MKYPNITLSCIPVRFDDIDNIAVEFQSIHFDLYTVLSEIDAHDLTQEEIIRKEFENSVYCAKEIHFALFSSPSTIQSKEPSVKLPKIDLPKFSGNVKDWPLFF